MKSLFYVIPETMILMNINKSQDLEEDILGLLVKTIKKKKKEMTMKIFLQSKNQKRQLKKEKFTLLTMRMKTMFFDII